MLIKKYGNRRLYDTDASRYITLEDLTESIRGGAEARVVDAKTGADLTQVTLTQIIMEGRGAQKLLPATLLHQLIRLGDDALADFLGRYVQAALELYLQARKTSQSFMPFNPLVALTQFAQNGPFGSWGQQQGAPQVPPPAPPAATSDVDGLRRELDELKNMLRKRKK
ncbi:MAG: polyhydroxyalkanoate synthesis regulator DNA-binding domain-containing protein [Myxococcaceae bacterium]